MGRYVLRFGTGVGCEDVKQFAERFYKGKKWQRIRALVWARDKGLCQRCLKDGIIKAGDTVHHIVEITPDNINDESISLNPENLMTVCRDCHAAIHKKSLDRRYEIDELGRVISPRS